MGWKSFKQHFRIVHIVQVKPDRVSIGSHFVSDLIEVGLDGRIIKECESISRDPKNELSRYQSEIRADPELVRSLLAAPDTFERSIPVYTYDGAEIIERQCETPGWPNATHDGHLMYSNTYSTDRAAVIRFAKKDAASGVKLMDRQVQELRRRLAEAEDLLAKDRKTLAALEAAYPTDPADNATGGVDSDENEVGSGGEPVAVVA